MILLLNRRIREGGCKFKFFDVMVKYDWFWWWWISRVVFFFGSVGSGGGWEVL